MFGFLKKKLGDVISRFSERAKEEEKELKPQLKEISELLEEEPKPIAAEKETVTKPVEVSEKPVPKIKPAAVAVEKAVVEESVIEIKKAELPKQPEKVEEATVEEPPIEIKRPEPAPEKGEQPRLEMEPKRIAMEEKPASNQGAAITEKPAPKAEATLKEKERKGLFSRITSAVTGAVATTRISAEKFEELFWDMEVALLENGVAVEVIDKIKADLKEGLVEKPLPRGKVEERIRQTLRSSVEGLFVTTEGLMSLVKAQAARQKPVKIMFVGINGSGKTTTIAKVAKLAQNAGLNPVMAAADTFRAAAIHQLQEHADRLGVKLVKHDYGSDPAAVAFDAIKYAEAHSLDVVLIDTAGRLHSNVNLVDEMKKIARVAKPDFKIFIGESITGNDCVEQARSFNEAIGIDGIILAKADVDEKGGAAISVSYVTKKPIFFLGTGQGYDDLQPFNTGTVVESLGLAG